MTYYRLGDIKMSKYLIPIVLVAILYFFYRFMPFIYFIMANKKYNSGDIEDALKFYEKAYNSKHSTPTIKIMYSYVLLRQAYTDKAERILKEILSQKISQKDKISAILNLSLVSWKKNDINEAISLLEGLYKDGIKTSVLYQNLGYYLILSGDYNKAIEFNLEAYDYSKDDPSLLDNLAMNYYFLDDYSKALEIYNKLIPMKPQFSTAYYYYAKTLVYFENYTEALDALNKALNCRFSFLSAVSKEDIENEINQIKLLV
ncbi:tetratricopeptide repeat protein [Clostridiales bacterium oral taxon 876 str. F0540]|nr:tetratricopeptide repeat protein [Clostridiales bacterium oral taxon 876 str. F0540]